MITTPMLHVGSPTHLGPLTLFPVWTDAPLPRRGTATTLPRGATIQELATGPEVERLTVSNPTEKVFLLPGGVMFDKGSQHRALVRSVLVGPDAHLNIDVRCVEQGRWDRSSAQRLHRRRAPLAVRGALRDIDRTRDATHCSMRLADQSEVWNRVHRYEQVLGSSPSGSLVEVTDRLDGEARQALRGVSPLPGQRGLLVGIGGHPVVFEVFDHPSTLARQWDAVLTALLADARLVAARPTSGRRARIFASHVSRRRLDPCAEAGIAIAVEARDELVVADGIVAGEDRLVHLSVLNARHELVGAA